MPPTPLTVIVYGRARGMGTAKLAGRAAQFLPRRARVALLRWAIQRVRIETSFDQKHWSATPARWTVTT